MAKSYLGAQPSEGWRPYLGKVRDRPLILVTCILFEVAIAADLAGDYWGQEHETYFGHGNFHNFGAKSEHWGVMYRAKTEKTLLVFQTGKTKGNWLKICFTRGIYLQYRNALKIIRCTECCYNYVTFVAMWAFYIAL